MVNRWGWVSTCLILSACGCSAGSRYAVRPETLPSKAASAEAIAPVVATSVAKINRNADALDGMTASTTVSVNQTGFGGGVSGQMALERPRNFSLKLERGFGTPVVDVGSNAREFWFWTKNSKDKAIYVGEFDSQGKLPPDVLVQPEWLVEAMGMRPISADEMDRIRVDRAREPGQIVLTHDRTESGGRSMIKRTVLDTNTNQVRQHLFYVPGESTRPVAVVSPSDYKRFPIESDTDEPGTAPRTVELPQRIQLQLTPTSDPKDQVQMVLVLRDVHLNPPFTETNRDALFTIPKISGTQVVSITPARVSEYAAQPRRASHDITRPPASLGSDLKPSEPRPMGIEGANQRPGDPVPLQPDLGASVSQPRGVEAIVRRTVPRPPANPNDLPLPVLEPPPGSLGAGFIR